MKNKFISRTVGLLTAAVLSASVTTCLPVSAETSSDVMTFLQNMGAGWNLGNTLDATGGSGLSAETSWGCPKTTQAMVEAVHDAGFNTIRIPVSWSTHVSDDYTIDSAWLARVKEVVDYAYDDGMYVILNIHHDNMWYEYPTDTDKTNDTNGTLKGNKSKGFYPDSAHKDSSIEYLTTVWEQIADEFKDYGERLVFETLNEPRLAGKTDEWWFDVNNPNAKVSDSIATINEFNQEIVNTIRATGSTNSTRYILCPGYCASIDGAMTSGFKLPTDPNSANDNKILVSVHAYTPYNLCLGSSTSTSSTYTQFTSSGKKELDSLFSKLDEKFLSNGIGVVIGENGISDKGNNDARTEWASYYFGLSAQYGIPCAIWDNYSKNGSNVSENHWHLNRKTCKWGDPDVINAIMTAMGVTNANIPIDETTAPKKEQTLSGTTSYTKTYGASAFTLDAKNTSSGGSALTYSSSDKTVATVSSAGKVTIVGAGTAKITVTAAANSSYNAATMTVTVKVNPKNISSTAVIGDIAKQYCTGSALKPKLTIKTAEGKTLVSVTDYTVNYSNNTNPGTALVLVTFKGNYTGTAHAEFSIIPATPTFKSTVSSTSNAARINWNSVPNAAGYRVYRYDTAEKKWKSIATVKTTTYRDENLSAATEYKYKVKAYSKSGSETIWGESSASRSAVTRPVTPKITKAGRSKTAVRLYWNKVKCYGYKIQQYDAAAKSWKTIATVSSSTTDYRISGLKSCTSYKFRIQAYTPSTPYRAYSSWSSTYTATTK